MNTAAWIFAGAWLVTLVYAGHLNRRVFRLEMQLIDRHANGDGKEAS